MATEEFTLLESLIRSFEKEMNGRFDEMEGRFNDVEGRFNDVEGRFNDVDAALARQESTLRRHSGMVLAGTVSIGTITKQLAAWKL